MTFIENSELFKSDRAIVLPEAIEHDTYRMVAEVALTTTSEPLILFCMGQGGNSQAAIAMANLLSFRGNVTGVLAGNAYSSHATVFAACGERFIYPGVCIGIHMAAWEGLDTRADAHYLAHKMEDFKQGDDETIKILKNASNETLPYWEDKVREVSGATVNIGYDELIRIGFARPIDEWVRYDPRP